MKKPTFPEPGCYGCECHTVEGSPPFETRFCRGGKWKRRGKRFRSSEPQYKAPAWCPKRHPSPICKIYGFANDWCRTMELENLYLRGRDSFIPLSSHYKLRAEIPLGMSAKAFYNAARKTILQDVIPGQDFECGEVLEIDNGLKSFFFVHLDSMTVLPLSYFQTDRIQK